MRAETNRRLKMLDRLIQPALVGKGIAQTTISHGKTRIKLERMFQNINRQIILAAGEINPTKGEKAVGVPDHPAQWPVSAAVSASSMRS